MSAPPDQDKNGIVLAQVALNTADMPGTLRLYSELFGFENAGGHPTWGDVARVQGLPADARWMTWWLVGGRPFFQLEVFQHTRPKQRSLPDDWRPSDHGWVRFGIGVDDFDRVASGLERWAIPILGAKGEKGRRRLAFRDPHVGVIVEVIERAGAASPAVVYATCSVPDLATARGHYQAIIGAEIEPLDKLHSPDDEALWGLAHAQREGFLVRVGDAFLEILTYSRPAGRPRPADHRICDQGIMNVALGSRNVDAIRAAVARIRASALKTTVAVDSGRAVGTYIIEPGFELELMGVPAELDAAIGFASVGPFAAHLSADTAGPGPG